MNLKIKGEFPISLDIMVEALVEAGSYEQGLFFNRFAERLRDVCGDHWKFEVQALYIRKELTEEAKELGALISGATSQGG